MMEACRSSLEYPWSGSDWVQCALPLARAVFKVKNKPGDLKFEIEITGIIDRYQWWASAGHYPWSGLNCILELNPLVRIRGGINDRNQWWSQRYETSAKNDDTKAREVGKTERTRRTRQVNAIPESLPVHVRSWWRKNSGRWFENEEISMSFNVVVRNEMKPWNNEWDELPWHRRTVNSARHFCSLRLGVANLSHVLLC